MSVNINVNGKYINNFKSHDLLIDPERVKKETENERRKMRIQQVREVSKNIAKKVRTDVELEKENQLRNIEQIKAEELEMWRKNNLSQKQKDFRSSIYQVGSAHRAAQLENNKRPRKKEMDTRARHSFKVSEKMGYNTRSADKENGQKNANVQTDITGSFYTDVCGTFENNLKSNSNEITSECQENSSDSSSYSSQSSSLSLSESEYISKSKEINQKKLITDQVKETVPVVLKCVQDKNDVLKDTTEINHYSNASNISFSKSLSNKTPKPRKYTESNKQVKIKSTSEEILSAPSTGAKLRFTQISDIIRLQNLSDKTKQPSDAKCGEEIALSIQKLSPKSKSPSSHLQKTQEPLFKPASISGPVSTQTASKTSSSRSTNTRVQFYDYNNKFHKQYDQPISAVEAYEPTSRSVTEMNAMELASLEIKSQESKEVEMNRIRHKSTEQCQKAIETEQVHRACEELTSKLDALTKQRHILASGNHNFASHRLNQGIKEKETNLNTAVEDVLRRPAIITCPVIDRRKPEAINATIHQQKIQFNGLNVDSTLKKGGNSSLNSSDSCYSILLGYVDDQSKKIAIDIEKFKTQNRKTDNAKAEKLQNLLNRINKLRENLLKELEQCCIAEASDKDRVQIMMDSIITDFRKEHENILIADSTKGSVEIRENNLKKKEAILEKKLREFYEMNQTAKKMKHLKTVQEQTGEPPNKCDNPMYSKKYAKKSIGQNILNNLANFQYSGASNKDKGQEENQNKKGIKLKGSDKKKVNEEEKFSSSEEESEDEFVDRQRVIVGQKPFEIIIKVKGNTKTKKPLRIPSKSPKQLSTLLQSPNLKKSRRRLTKVRSIDSSSTSYRSLPSKIQTNVDKILKNIPTTSKSKAYLQPQSETASTDQSENFKKKTSNLNPLMVHYVQRLLGMSRTSINALGVTSSDIETPSNSILNTTANLSAAETERLASSRLENVQKFIVDNYSFIEQLEESLRHSLSTDSNLKTAEIAWKSALKERNEKKDTDVIKPVKPSLKKLCKAQKTEFKDDKNPISHVDKSTQMTDNCTQRIAELTEMISKVRKEKQKILETTLSSASENGRNSTEYLDLPDRRTNGDQYTSNILDPHLVKSVDNLPTQYPETRQRLAKDKPIGISQDSGISVSRPITVQESRGSIIDDIPQVQSLKEPLLGQKPKPPISISRYSPQLPEEIPHELSTIFEIETPATSRHNPSAHASNIQGSSVQVIEQKTDQIAYRNFPTFEKYTRINNLDMTQFNPEFSLQFEKEFSEFINHAKELNDADYKEFSSLNNYLAKSTSSENKEGAEELLASLKLANLSFKRFPTRKEYLNKIGVSISDLINSQSFDNGEESKQLISNSSSSSSLINIANELKLRDILIKPIQQNNIQNDKGSKGSSPIALQSKQEADVSDIIQFTSDCKSTDEQSVSLEEDLKNIGINWASTMKKKTIETQAISSSNSSNLEQSVFTIRRKHNYAERVSENNFHKQVQTNHDTTTQTFDGGEQLNLREFLKKELLIRTATSSSFSFSDDSVASSILRSILGSITPSGRQQKPNDVRVPTLDRHKTSTPMVSQSTSSDKVGIKSHGGTSSLQLFSGESRLSSVHLINGSTNVNNPTEN